MLAKLTLRSRQWTSGVAVAVGRKQRGLGWRVGFAFAGFVVAFERERASRDTDAARIMHQGILLAVRHPQFARAQFLNCLSQLFPIGVIGDDQRQLDALLA